MGVVFYEYFKHKDNIFYLALLFVCLYFSYATGALREYWFLVLLLFLAPWFEWIIHKFALHVRHQSKYPGFQDYLDKIHLYHHQDPKYIPYVYAPFPVPLVIPVSFFLVISLLLLSFHAGLAIFTFTLAYYLYYEWIHLAHHIDSYTPVTKRGKILKKAHQWHHYKNENFWWGVTSSLGDKTLKTWMDPKEVERSPTVRNFSGKD